MSRQRARGGPDVLRRGRWRGRSPLAAVAPLLLAAAACSGAPAAETSADGVPVFPPEPSASAPPSPDAAPEPSSPPEPSAPPPVEDDPTVVVIEEGEADGPRGLVAASRAERERRRREQREPVMVITDENLSELATGKVTFAGEAAGEEPAGEGSEGGEAGEAPEETLSAEEYWRREAREHRLRWLRAVEEAERLEEDAALLRRRFYTEDDPYVRDGEIKPAWDRALARLRRTRREAREAREALAAFLEEGRRAGALPGWLREGIELEPELPEEGGQSRPPDALERHRAEDPERVGSEDDGGERPQ